MSIAIVWFRQDLRCEDNPALTAACKNHQAIIPLYIASSTPQEGLGGAQGWWLHHSLLALQQKLQTHGLDLCLKRGNPLVVINELIKQFAVTAVYWNRCYDPQSFTRDKQIAAELSNQGCQVINFNASLLNEPWTLKNKEGHYFKVFTPFWRQSLQQLSIPAVNTIQSWPDAVALTSESLSDWHLTPHWSQKFAEYWQPGEIGAIKKLDFFIENNLSNYKDQRNIPSAKGTSHLSPHLHFGEISPWQIMRRVEAVKSHPGYNIASIEQFLAELGWREFSYYLLYHFPRLAEQNFRQEFDQFPWENGEDNLRCWQSGQTGYPIVDAGMRELWHTGYMHNRVRMIVASFLIKDLLIDWRIGVKWFGYTLLDADIANNSASWQWVAGCGTDAAPYFRIFNPVLQGEKFDPQGDYVKSWLPELAQVSSKWVHKPWQAPNGQLSITLGKDYPFPIVDHAVRRAIALDAYKTR